MKLAEIKNNVKKRTAVWLYPETIEKMDNLLERDNCKSRSEFIDKALNFYMGYLVSEDTTGYLSKILISAMQGTLKETENRNSSNIFRLSVEMSMMMNILAAGLEISEEELRNLRGRCVQQVKKARGKVSMEEAIKFQQGIGE
ncbi:hypothetical protein SAMN02745248_00826 [Hathewaya proteolytica DSM 3090]|uniref:Ribbon-helix-helix protein, copG family n=1 Tax=Hathewaya proteolytica DSM 3090 TaxID=1121331 RepID=A0A1M6LUB1_9CLOT|nr:hypothetical protein SAMN02745248_00826 [Hathewaya proteolytica DSM 3090]